MKDRKHIDEILKEMVAQLVDEETNSNDLAFLVGGGDLPVLSKEQKRKSMVSKKYRGEKWTMLFTCYKATTWKS